MSQTFPTVTPVVVQGIYLGPSPQLTLHGFYRHNNSIPAAGGIGGEVLGLLVQGFDKVTCFTSSVCTITVRVCVGEGENGWVSDRTSI